jgi:hypothetical protein
MALINCLFPHTSEKSGAPSGGTKTNKKYVTRLFLANYGM